jgi:hypothetical protein
MLTASAGYWLKFAKEKFSKALPMIQFAAGFGTGSLHITNNGNSPENHAVRYAEVSAKVVARLRSYPQFLWFAGLGLFERFYDFEYLGVDVNSSKTYGPGQYTHFTGGIGLSF